MKNTESQLEELTDLIHVELDSCDMSDTPFVCAELSTEGGKKKLTDIIINDIINRGSTICESIISIEKEYNPNLNVLS